MNRNYMSILPPYLVSDKTIDYHGAIISPKTENETVTMFVSRVVLALNSAGLMTEVSELNSKFKSFVDLYGTPVEPPNILEEVLPEQFLIDGEESTIFYGIPFQGQVAVEDDNTYLHRILTGMNGDFWDSAPPDIKIAVRQIMDGILRDIGTYRETWDYRYE